VSVALANTRTRRRPNYRLRRNLTEAAAIALALLLMVWTLAPIYNMIESASTFPGNTTKYRQIIRDMLAPTDYEITEVESGEEALAAIAKQPPDLILMDIQLPIMDGYTATRRIKADPALRSIKIIAVTSYALSGEEKKAREAGCDEYVPKPFSPRQLLAKIRQYLS
jgi:two-component system, cell cycle response regulator DivK